MLHIERAGKLFYCPLKDNRQVNEGDADDIHYQRVDSLEWNDEEHLQGKSVHVKDFPKGHRLQLFRLVLSTERTDYVGTSDVTQTSTDDTQQVCAIRWKTRAVAPGSQTTDGVGELPVSQGTHPAQSHCVLFVGLVTAQRTSV